MNKIQFKKTPSLNGPCTCGSGKQYKNCCLLSTIYETPKLKYNKKYGRYETRVDHLYAPFNYSNFVYENSKPYRGKIKCRLVHTEGNSVIIPDYILLNNGGWIQPLFFTAPLLAQTDDEVLCTFYSDIQYGQTLKIKFSSKDLIHFFEDKSQLFHCNIFAPKDIETYSCGDYSVIENKIYLKLFHHTNNKGFNGIMDTKTLWSSKWNYRGSMECLNYNFVYFTDIPMMKYASDLITVAMSEDGNIDYAIDSFKIPDVVKEDFREKFKDYIYTAKVYRSTTKDREHSLKFLVPVEAIDIKHTYLHYQGGLYFYEVCFPHIHRLKTTAKSTIPFDDNFKINNSPPLVYSDYSVIGDAQTKEGLAAPFEEEQTQFIFKIEDCGRIPIPEYWFANANKDLYTDKIIETMEMKTVIDNPTK